MAIQYWLNRFDPTLLLYSFSSLSPTLHKIIIEVIHSNESSNKGGK